MFMKDVSDCFAGFIVAIEMGDAGERASVEGRGWGHGVDSPGLPAGWLVAPTDFQSAKLFTERGMNPT